jgi:putative transposase
MSPFFLLTNYWQIISSSTMARTARASVGNICYHVINRGNGSARVFHKHEDYFRFTEMMQQANERLPMRVVGWCLMPNHFHLVLWPFANGDLSRWMQWLMTCHVRRYHRHYKSCGHIWQGRFKAFPIQQDGHYLTVLRYIERNPLRAKLVKASQDWQWSSLSSFKGGSSVFGSDGPVQRPKNWLNLVNCGQDENEIDVIRRSVNRGTPFGDDDWNKATAVELGLESSLKARGRPKKQTKK